MIDTREAAAAGAVQRAIPLNSPLEWKRALSGVPHSFFHTWEHSYAMHLSTSQTAFLYCLEFNGERVVCPFLERTFGDAMDIATPYGFSGFAGTGSLHELPDLWRGFAAARGYVSAFLNLHPVFCQPEYADPATLFEQKELYILDATMDIEAVLAGCGRGRRRELRQWRNQSTLHTERNQLKSFVLTHYREFFEAKNASAAYDFSIRTMEFLLEQENVLLLGAGTGSRLEAVNVFAFTSYGAEGLFHFTRPGVSRHSAGLTWEALTEVRRRGIPHLNLGGGLSRNDQLAKFKSRFGVAPRVCYAVKQVLAPERYAELCLRTGVNPEERAGYFPAYRNMQRSPNSSHSQ